MRPTISRAEVFAIARSLGADPVETNHIEITGKAVTVVTYKLNASGGRYVDESTGEAAIETTVIPIVGDGNAETVRMRHPSLPGQEIDVRPRGAGQRAMAGWEVVDSPFAKGGFIPSGVTEVKNTTGEPIPVVPIPPPEPFNPGDDGFEHVGDKGVKLARTDDGKWVAAVEGHGWVPDSYATRAEAVAAAEAWPPEPPNPEPPPERGTKTEAPAEPGASSSPAPRRRKASTKKQEEDS